MYIGSWFLINLVQYTELQPTNTQVCVEICQCDKIQYTLAYLRKGSYALVGHNVDSTSLRCILLRCVPAGHVRTKAAINFALSACIIRKILTNWHTMLIQHCEGSWEFVKKHTSTKLWSSVSVISVTLSLCNGKQFASKIFIRKKKNNETIRSLFGPTITDSMRRRFTIKSACLIYVLFFIS